MFSISTIISILIIFSQAARALPRGQTVLASTQTSVPQVEVPGHNHAYFTQISKEDQLFSITDLAVYPDPPKVNEHSFTLVHGWIDERYPGLENAMLKASGVCPDYGELEEIRIADMSNPIVRHHKRDGSGYEYGGPIRHGINEILFDAFLPWWGYEPLKENCSVEATARLPDMRILFSIAMNFTVQWPPSASD